MGEMGTEGPIRVMIADDHRLFRAGLRLILSREEAVEIVGEAADGVQAIDVVRNLQPDVVLINITMPGMDGMKPIQAIKQESPATKPLLLTSARDETTIFKALRAGARGYLSKDASAPDLVKAIQAIHYGELWVERSLIARFFESETLTDVSKKERHEWTQERLTTREQEVLRLLASGGTNKDIAHVLCISEKTVKCHVNHIFQKLHVTRRLQAVLYAIQRGLS